jgi:4-amino-4-deoxy-L-arabinose transferase-like glycosyltransferase
MFYALWLGTYPLFTPDEGRYAEAAREMIASGDYITPRVSGIAFLDKPVLYYWLQALAISLFGVKEWAIRFFPMLSGLLGCLMTYICGRLLFGRRSALLAALLLATAPLYFGSAHYANLDLEVAVFISCSLLCFITGVQQQTYSKAFLYTAYLFAALAVLTKGLIGLVFPLLIIGSWIALQGQWRLLKNIHLFSGILIFSALVLPWYVLVQKANPNFLHYFFVTQHFTRFLSAAEFNNKTVFWFYLPIVLGGFFPWTIFLFQALTQAIRNILKKPKQHSSELFLILWLILVFTFFSIPHSKIVTYILPMFPALALLTGHYLSCIWDRMGKKNYEACIAAFCLINIIFAAILLTQPEYQWLEMTTGFTPYLTALSLILMFFAAISLLLIRKKVLAAIIVTFAISNILFLSTLTLGASYLNQRSAKPLAMQLKAIIQPQDEVVHYFKFFQDVPLYLGQNVSIVANWHSPTILTHDNWIRELSYGMSFPDTDKRLINEEVFWKRWHSNKRIFVFISSNYLKQFKQQANFYFYIAKHNDIYLLSNQASILTLWKYPALASNKGKNRHERQNNP